MLNARRINAGPTKAFFVKMLTRDIELADAILDLLDNCVDGVVRTLRESGKDATTSKPYAGYEARIVATPDKFEIQDNCGGIPLEIAEKSAFMLGRPDVSRDSDIETVGMYGIGMKRAMFKMGRDSIVMSRPSSGPYKVEVPSTWLDDEPSEQKAVTAEYDPWKLDLVPMDISPLQDDGTLITVKQLYPEIARQFDSDKSSFLADLEKEISRHYALIMDKGFSVFLNEKKVTPVNLTILSPDKLGPQGKPSIEPYLFVGEIEGVHVELAVGFYRPLATEAELADEELVSSSRENAGWTVICNDRVVLYNDKTFKTGWGTKGVTPGYHNQFISIRGIVSFRSKNSMALPLNTTKRGLATDSLLYQACIDHMRSGLKHFTTFTNKWKKQEEETTVLFRSLTQKSLSQIISQLSPSKMTPVRSLPDTKQFVPDLPKPEPVKKQRRICFAADEADIATVATFYFDDAEFERQEVGRRCFDESLKRAKRGK